MNEFLKDIIYTIANEKLLTEVIKVIKKRLEVFLSLNENALRDSIANLIERIEEWEGGER